MKTIGVSTAVFAAIWAERQVGEETEDAILRRLLRADPQGAEPPVRFAQEGVTDDRHGVQFAEGFEIFRTYKGKDYRAKATRGRWLLENDSSTYPSLHKLSSAVAAGSENSWLNWKYRRHDGSEDLIDRLRHNAGDEA